MNPRSLSPVQLAVLLALGRLGFAVHEEVITEARWDDAALAAQALRFLVNRQLAEAGAFYGGKYGYRLTFEGQATVRKAAA